MQQAVLWMISVRFRFYGLENLAYQILHVSGPTSQYPYLSKKKKRSKAMQYYSLVIRHVGSRSDNHRGRCLGISLLECFDHGSEILNTGAYKSALVMQSLQMYSFFISNSDVFMFHTKLRYIHASSQTIAYMQTILKVNGSSLGEEKKVHSKHSFEHLQWFADEHLVFD